MTQLVFRVCNLTTRATNITIEEYFLMMEFLEIPAGSSEDGDIFRKFRSNLVLF